MNISLSTYHALYEFLREEDPRLAETFADSAEGEYDFILESLNIRQRGEVQIDPSIFYGKEEEFYKKALANLSEWEDMDYISHVDQKLIDNYEMVVEYFGEVRKNENVF